VRFISRIAPACGYPVGVLYRAVKTAGWRQAADGTTADAPAGISRIAPACGSSAATRQRAVPRLACCTVL